MRLQQVFYLIGSIALMLSSCVLETTNAQAEPTGLTGSYVGANIDLNRGLDNSYDWLRQVDYKSSWFLDRALDLYKATAPVDQATASNITTQTSERTFQGRIDLKDSPISIRGKFSVSPAANVVQPMVSYDFAIARNANLYAGAGYSFNTLNSGKSLATGNRDAVVVVTGAEAAISPNVVIYGDAQFRLNPPGNQMNTPPRIQVGAGYRF